MKPTNEEDDMIAIECHTCQVRIDKLDIGPQRAEIIEWLTDHHGHNVERIHP